MKSDRENFEEYAPKRNLANIETMLKAHEAYCNDPELPEAQEFTDGILCVDKQEVYTITQGTGGPAYGFRVYVDVLTGAQGNVTREVSRATAWYQDWGTKKYETPLTDDEMHALLSLVYIEGVSE